MIKEQINITCGGSTYENCTLIVPSQVQTSTPQEETLDLEKSPNFQIVVPGVYLDKGTHEITFSVGGNDCTANMIVVNNGSVSCTLQYVDGMTIEEGDSSDDSSDDGSSDDPDEPVVDPVLSQSINNILGSNYDVVNDMSEEDALAEANNILYGDEEPPR